MVESSVTSIAPRKVLLLSNTLEAGGTERNVCMFARMLDRAAYVPEVWVLRPGGAFDSKVRDAGVAIRDLHRGSSYSPAFAWRAARAIAESDADLLHAFHPAITFYAGLARALFGSRKPLIVSYGTTTHPNRVEATVYRHFIRRNVDRVIANSASVRDFCVELGHAENSIVVIGNGHDSARFETPFDRAAIRAELGFGVADFGIIFVGRMIESKRVRDLIETLRLLAARGISFRAALIGDGPLRGDLEARIRAAGLQDRVRLLGFRDDVADCLRGADLFAFPSVVEGLPNSVIEAQLAGLPIVAANIPGTSDVIAHDRTGRLVPPEDPPAMAAAIEALSRDVDARRRLGEAASVAARDRFGQERAVLRLQGVYDGCLSSRGR